MSQRGDEFALPLASKASDRAKAAEQEPPAFDERLRGGLRAADDRVLPTPRHQHRARHDRQRLALRLSRAPDRLPRPRSPSSAQPSLSAPTNGKAERVIRAMLQGWAYGEVYGSTTERTRALDGWLNHYNHHRPHLAITTLLMS
jgi:hypothetical protein